MQQPPQQGYYGVPPHPPQKKGMSTAVKVLLWVGGISIVMFGGCAVLVVAGMASVAKDAKTNSASVGARKALGAPDYEISVEKLVNDFKANEARATIDYKDRIVLVTGTVTGVDTGITDAPTVKLDGSGLLSVNASGLTLEEAAQFNTGDAVRLKCMCGGEVLGSPILNDCRPE